MQRSVIKYEKPRFIKYKVERDERKKQMKEIGAQVCFFYFFFFLDCLRTCICQTQMFCKVGQDFEFLFTIQFKSALLFQQNILPRSILTLFTDKKAKGSHL
jgi:hypothetical protein